MNASSTISDGFLSRRRFLSIAAAAAGSAAVPGGLAHAAPKGPTAPVVWRGIALGAPAMISLIHPDQARAERSIRRALAELKRLEAIFSLHDPKSALVKLNRNGVLRAPPLDLVRLLSMSRRLSGVTGGVFDPTIQPLWQLYAEHFARNQDDNRGPKGGDIERALALVDYRGVSVASDTVNFQRRGMALSLNGIAQGYITDRIVDLLRRDGFASFVADLGEPRAVGSQPNGAPWRVRLAMRDASDVRGRHIDVVDRAVATSAPSGTPFEATGRFHHLLDPRTGRCASEHNGVSVVAPTAVVADGLSTAFAVMPRAEIDSVLAHYPDVRVLFA